ncbi:MAG: prolipoprotein diacylglyceryl transferase [Bacilli bacterium]|nr:prolipoprotein diacylglyceryl transferase [Bacilli bacterium]
MERIAFEFGFIKIYWYSIFIFLGVITSYSVILMEAKKRGFEKQFIVDLVFNTVIIGLIGARIYYCLFHLSYYLKHPLEIVQIWNGGLAIHGGILFGGIFVTYYCKKHKVELLKMIDIIVVGVILGQAIGRWGNFFNGEAYGGITSLTHLQSMHLPRFIIDGMYILGEYRQPTFLYESFFNMLGFMILVIIRKYPYLKIGQLTGFYFMWYSFTRFMIEGMRTDSLMIGKIKMAQLVSIILLIVGFIIFIYYKRIKKVSKTEHLYRDNGSKLQMKQPLFL